MLHKLFKTQYVFNQEMLMIFPIVFRDTQILFYSNESQVILFIFELIIQTRKYKETRTGLKERRKLVENQFGNILISASRKYR